MAFIAADALDTRGGLRRAGRALARAQREAAQAHRHDGADRGAGRRARSKSSRGRARTAPRSKASCTSRSASRPGRSIRSSSSFTADRPARRGRPPSRARSIYPIDIWTANGALVLEPNYRGSAGYGEAFRSLNVRNLGVGDAWDVLSGIDYLIKEGLADPEPGGDDGLEPGRLHLGVPRPRTTARASRRSRSAPASPTG